MLLMQ